MLHELKMFFMFKKYSLLEWMEYRFDFIIGAIAMALVNVVSILMFYVIFMYIPLLNGWSFHQVLFIVGFMTLSFGIWHLLCESMSPWYVEGYIWRGEMDRVLLLPMSTLGFFFSRSLDLDGLGDLLMGIAILFYAAINIGITWTLPMLFLLGILLFSSFLIYLAINIFFAAFNFFFTRTRAFADLFFRLHVFVKYPIDIYNPIITFILTFVFPIAFVSYYPSEVFLGQGIYQHLSYLTPLVAAIMFVGAYVFWKFGVRNYTSVG
ncbi:MAG: ABC transporter permease, partial [Candidatus Aenigmatarchaeota archaeon]